MMKRIYLIACLVLPFFFVSCNDSESLDYLNRIKDIGDSNPKQAMLMYDSIRPEITKESEYVRMKSFMLEMRLRDKAFMKATKCDSAKLITEYFATHTNRRDAVEAFYYAGSVYRDMKDLPNALKNFLKAEELATSSTSCDSIMLVNIYSNLAYTYFCVQDYSHALKMALKEYKTAKEINSLNVVTIVDVGESYLRLDDYQSACKYYIEALDMILLSGKGVDVSGSLYTLLYGFSFMKKIEKADKCYSIICKMGLLPPPLQLGEYYKLKNNLDAAISCYQSVIREADDLSIVYDASRNLYDTYKTIGDKDSINKYASLYIQISDSIDLGKRQEMASSVNNQYHYYRNIEEESRIKEENIRYQMWLYIVFFSTVLLFLVFFLYHIWKKSKQLKVLLDMSEQLKNAKKKSESLNEEIDIYKSQLANSEMSLAKTKLDLERVNNEICHYEEEVQTKEKQLIEKLEENKRFILLLHKADLKESAEDIVKSIRHASEGKYKMSDSEWQKFYHAVDELQPDLSEKIARHLGKFTEEQQKVCYLLSIGLSNTQIANLTNIPHVTVWRWVKKFNWI